MVTKAHNLKIENKKFRETLSLKKPAVKKRYQVVYEETFETNVPGTAAHIIYQTKDLIKGKKVLDLGCGAGRLSLFAAKYAKEVFGIDYIEKAIDYANNFAEITKSKNITFQVGDLDLFKNEKFDVILISDVLQHVDDPLKTLKQCHKILKKNGLVIISIPNFNNFRGHVWLTLQSMFNLPMSLTDTFQITSEEMKKLSKKAKLKLIKTTGYSFEWGWSDWAIEDMKRRINLATKDGKMEKLVNLKSINNWLDSKYEFNSEYLKFLENKKYIKKRPLKKILNIPSNCPKNIKQYLDDGNSNINRFYSNVEPFNKMGAGAIYILKK
jgi:ubiquinone biosynthesis O-methyltransferase